MAIDVQAPAPTKTGRIVHYEIGAKDAKKLVAFYGAAFGWKFQGAPGMDDYLMSQPDGGADADIAIYDSEEAPRVTNYIGVDDVRAAAARITAAGGTLAHKFTVPYMGHGAVAFDPEGNPIGIWQADRSATGESWE